MKAMGHGNLESDSGTQRWLEVRRWNAAEIEQAR